MEEHLLTQDSILMLLSAFLNSVPVGYINVVPLVYLAEIGYDPATIGFIYSVSAIALTIGLIPFGLLADRHDKKGLLIVGTSLSCISYAIFGLTLDPSLLTVASAIGGIGFAGGLGSAITSPTLIPMIAGSTSEKKRSTLFGVLGSTWSLALTIGAALSFLPNLFSSSFAQSEKVAHFESYFIMSGIAAVSVIPLFFVGDRRHSERTIPSESNAVPPQPTSLKRSYHFSVGSWSRIAKFCLVFAFIGFGLGVLVQLLPTWYAMRFGASEDIIGFWMAVSNLATIVSIPLIPMLVSRKGSVTTIVATGILGALVLATMPFTGVFETAAILFAVRSVIYGLSWAVLQSYMMSVVGESERGTMIGFVYTAWGIGSAVGILLGGEFLGAGLFGLPFIAAITSYLISSVAILIFFRHIKPPEELTRFNLPRFSE